MVAERDTNDRYLAAYLSERVGEEFTGRSAAWRGSASSCGWTRPGPTVLIPTSVRACSGAEFFHFDREAGTLMGADTGLTLTIGLGQRVTGARWPRRRR